MCPLFILSTSIPSKFHFHCWLVFREDKWSSLQCSRSVTGYFSGQLSFWNILLLPSSLGASFKKNPHKTPRNPQHLFQFWWFSVVFEKVSIILIYSSDQMESEKNIFSLNPRCARPGSSWAQGAESPKPKEHLPHGVLWPSTEPSPGSPSHTLPSGCSVLPLLSCLGLRGGFAL